MLDHHRHGSAPLQWRIMLMSATGVARSPEQLPSTARLLDGNGPYLGPFMFTGCLLNMARPPKASVAQQVVDRGLGARALVDDLGNDHAVAGGLVGTAAHGAGMNHGIGRHLADVDLPRLAIDDAGV